MSSPALILGTGSRDSFPGWVAPAAIGSAVLAVLLGLVTRSWVVALVVVLCASAGVVGWADVTLRRIPNVACASLATFAVVVGVFVGSSGLASVAVGALVTALPFLVLHVIEPAWVGFGDVKLLAAVGAALGLLSPVAGLSAAWLAGVAALIGRPFVPDAWRRSVPFGFWLSLMSVPVAVWFGVAS